MGIVIIGEVRVRLPPRAFKVKKVMIFMEDASFCSENVCLMEEDECKYTYYSAPVFFSLWLVHYSGTVSVAGCGAG